MRRGAPAVGGEAGWLLQHGAWGSPAAICRSAANTAAVEVTRYKERRDAKDLIEAEIVLGDAGGGGVEGASFWECCSCL